MSVMIDHSGSMIYVSDDGLARIDGIPMFRRVIRDGVVFIQFADNDRMRAKCRGTRFIEVPLDVLNSLIAPPPPPVSGP